ncbi:MAG: AraC family transcriptional regulator [Proteobacteria bacterium]|nr:AraC family transcriptional regulator [Pseudomonadota bacterium]
MRGVSTAQPASALAASARHLTWDDVAARWGVHPRHMRRVAKRIGLRPMDAGHRTKRFRVEDVVAAEARQAGDL